MDELIRTIKFDKDGLIPAIIQDVESGQVLMLAYMNQEAIKLSLKSGKTHFWSRSRQKLWMKGESSGHTQAIEEMYFDCDKDALLVKVKQTKAACHTGKYSCFFNRVRDDYELVDEGEKFFSPDQVYGIDASVLKELYEVVVDRKEKPKQGSYTNYLFDKGLDKILKKVGEEAAEVIIASKNQAKDEIIYEVSDLIYHLIVLLVDQEVGLDDIYKELRKRR